MAIDVDFSVSPNWSYAYAGTRRSPIRVISVRLLGDLPDSPMSVYPTVRFDTPFDHPMASPWSGEARVLEVAGPNLGQPIEWSDIRLQLNYPLLGRIEEKAAVNAVVEIIDERTGAVVASRTESLTLLGRQDWLWDSRSRADTLTAFVNPRSAAVRQILATGREILGRATGDPSTEGYQSGPLRAQQIAQSVYEAICSLDINYSNPPAGFDGMMQRIRTPDEVIGDRAGTCLDTTILLASCWAEAGLEPVLFLIRGHAFAGYLTDVDGNAENLARQLPHHTLSATEHADLLALLLHQGHVQPIETTTMCSGPLRRPFLEAAASQNNFRPGDTSAVEAMVVVSSAWRAGITPPIRLADASLHTAVEGPLESSFEKRLGGDSDVDGSSGPALSSEVASDINSDESHIPPRVRQWMASLLDLSARNPLLRVKKGSLEFEVPPALLGKLDDRLFERNGRVTITSPASLPQSWLDNGVSPQEFEAWSMSSLQLVSPPYRAVNGFARSVASMAREVVDQAAEKGAFISDLEAGVLARQIVLGNFDQALDRSLKAVKQKAKDTLLETGTNCMFLALGAVTWTSESEGRGKRSVTNWEAPLYLYPVILDGGRKTPYTLRLDPTGEATPNHCLREKLRRDPYNIDLPELINPATDESGLDFDRMFDSIRGRLAEARMHNFAVVPRAYLGVFEYSTFRLWADLHDSWREMIERSDAARHLILTPNQPFTVQAPPPGPAPEPYLPIDADDSQEQAIRWALEGRSFRLEGPPGTGKTQTITNLLASCLAHGKKILFVAEKQTALDQVKKRMASIGLADYCLDLHAQGDSDARIRKNIQTALSAALAAQADAREADWNDVAFRMSREIEVLDNYRDALHNLGPAELSAWGAHERLLEFPALEPVPLPPGFLMDFSTQWPEVRRTLYEIRDLSSQAGTVTTNPWSFIDTRTSPDVDDETVQRLLREIAARTQDLAQLQDVPPAVSSITNPVPFALLARLTSIGSKWGEMNALVLSGAATTSTWAGSATAAGEAAKNLLERLDGSPLSPTVLLRDDLENLIAMRAEIEKSKFIARRKRMKAFTEALSAGAQTNDDTICSAFDRLTAERAATEALRTTLETELGFPISVTRALLEGAGDLDALISEIIQISVALTSVPGHRESISALLNGTSTVSAVTARVIESVGEAWARFLDVLPISAERFPRRFGEGPLTTTVPATVASLLASASATGRFIDLERWIRLMASAGELERLGFEGHIQEIADGTFDVEEFANRVQFSVVQQALRERVQSGNLDRFDRKTHDARVRALEAALNEARQILMDRIAGLIKSRSSQRVLPSGRQGGETQDLIRGLKPTRGEKVPIRDLISKFGESLADAMPCFMMSPDSVASLVPVGAIDFDVVVFDEASQVRTSHAIGALGRGRAGIVVGDSKQMPPSASFSSNQGTYIEDDDTGVDEADDDDIEQVESGDEDDGDPITQLLGEAARDAESILTEFEESAFPALQLMCHYRSRDELLIAFSNTHVYDEPMLTFPSTAGLASRALSLRVVEGGRFERNTKGAPPAPPWIGGNSKESVPTHRTNIAEAQAVVEEILSRLRDPDRIRRRAANPGTSAESIIVVTFNRPQMMLIEAMLRDADPDLYAAATAEWTDEETGIKHDSQVKVRNLENVQGDEAETVIFSVAFSARPDGYFPLNFGPVTQGGGIRRLNVAVTRAQVEMIVFSSFRPAAMGDLSSKREEIQMLQRFLQLAESGAQTTGNLGVGVSRSAHLRDIASSIESMGFETQIQLGLSQMRVDIAVKRPTSPKWELAILADDPNWASRGSAYQREILPLRVLKGLGWRDVVRVWLPAWLEEREAVLSDLRTHLDALDREVEKVEVPEPEGHDLTTVPPSGPPPDEEGVTERTTEGIEIPADSFMIDPSEPGISQFTPYEVLPVGDVTILDRATGDASARSVVRELIAKAVAVEGPIEHRRLAKIVANCLGLNRVTEGRITQVLQFIDPSSMFTDAIGTFVYAPDSQPSSLVGFRLSQEATDRQPEEISAPEYANALVWLLRSARSLSVADTVRELGAIFGFKRMTKNVTQVLNTAIESAIGEGRVVLDGDRYRLPD